MNAQRPSAIMARQARQVAQALASADDYSAEFPLALTAADLAAPFPGLPFRAAGGGAALSHSFAAAGASGSAALDVLPPASGAAIHLDDSTMLLLRCIAVHEGLPGEKPEDTIFAIVRDVARTIGMGSLARAVANHRERTGLRPALEDSS